MNRARCVATALAVMTALASVAGAAGPLLVNGAGQPLVWAPAPIPFHPDRGPLGALPNAAAVAIVAADFATWAAVPSASLSFSNAGPLPVDVTGANYMSYLGKCGDGLDPIIFDDDGSIIDDLFGVGASADVLGFASPECMTFVPPVLTEGSAVLNGRWLNGIQTDADPEITLDELEGVLVHEIGHYLNLDHSQVNLEEALDDDGANDDVVPTMFPYLVNGRAQRSLALDDVVAVSSLYPAPSFAAGSGGITGRVLRADGVTPFQGAYVVARRVGDPRATAVGAASGARFFPTVLGAPAPPGLRGLFELPGLPAGDYTVEVGPIASAFSGGSSVGPVDPPPHLPGPPELWNGAAEAATRPPDDPGAAVAVPVGVGAVHGGVDVVLNVPPVAPNDACGAPTVIAATPFRDQVDTSAATSAPGDPVQTCSPGGPSPNAASVWYRVTPPVAGTVRVDTAGSTDNTVLSAYTGSCAALTSVACNDEGATGRQSEVAFRVAAGTPYTIEVTRFAAATGAVLDFALDFLPGCGDAVVQAGEACDSGVANGADRCCTAVCRPIDADGDGTCDARDRCPGAFDPAQDDVDDDGVGDACDPCRTLGAGQHLWDVGKLVVAGLGDGVSGNERLRLRGLFALATGAFTVDPLTRGARLEVRGADALPRLAVTVPAGPYTHPGPGWARVGSMVVFKDRREGGTGGVTALRVRDRGAGVVKVSVTVRRTSLAIGGVDLPLAATLVLGDGAAGECGELSFAAAECTASPAGTRISCR